MIKKRLVNLYARVSTEDQNVNQQILFLKRWAGQNGYCINKIIKDVESGLTPLVERKKFKKILEYSKESKTDIVIYNL